MNNSKNILFRFTIAALMLSATLVAEKSSPGEKLDSCIDNAKEMARDVKDNIKDKADQARDKINEARDHVGDNIKHSK